jgi:hypothetical protein
MQNQEVKTFHDKQKMRECMTARCALQKVFKGFLHPEVKE